MIMKQIEIKSSNAKLEVIQIKNLTKTFTNGLYRNEPKIFQYQVQSFKSKLEVVLNSWTVRPLLRPAMDGWTGSAPVTASSFASYPEKHDPWIQILSPIGKVDYIL